VIERARLTGRKAASEDVQSLLTLPSFRLHLLADHSERAHEQYFKRLFGLNLRECRVLESAGAGGDASLRQIRQNLNLGRAELNAPISRLVRRGLLARIVDARDRRVIKFALTGPGRTTQKALRAAAVSLNEEWLSSISRRQRETFSTCLDMLITSARTLRKMDLAAILRLPSAHDYRSA
jgi:DNA-binding MarR family transcriptional regulator